MRVQEVQLELYPGPSMFQPAAQVGNDALLFLAAWQTANQTTWPVLTPSHQQQQQLLLCG